MRLSPSRLELKFGNFLSAATAGLDHERRACSLTPLFSISLLSCAEGFEIGDVALVVIGDVRDHHPVAMQVGAGNLLDARQRFWSTAPDC